MTKRTTLFGNHFFIFPILFLFAYSSINAQSITSVTPNKGQLGDQLNVFIGGQNVNFFNGSSSIQTTFSRGTTSISAPPVSVNQAGDTLEVFLDLGNTAYPTGVYDLSMNTPAHGVLTLNNAFEIDTTALLRTIPNSGFSGQTFNVLLVGQAIDYTTIIGPPTYRAIGGSAVINTSIVGVRGSDTLEITVNLTAPTILPGNYDLSLSTPGGSLSLRNALEIKTTNISGTVFFDPNTNVIQDAGENGIQSVRLELLPGGLITSTNNQGNYRFDNLAVGTYDIVITPPNNSATTNPSDTLSVMVSSLGSFNASFGLTSTVQNNTTIYANSGIARCNRFVDYRVTISNEGIAPSNGVYYFVKDSLITYNSGDIAAADSVKGDTIFFSFSNLQPFTSFTRAIIPSLPSITVLPVGQTILGESNVVLLDAMNNIIPGSVNTHVTSTIVRCSYDPNDKLVNPVGDSLEGFIEPNTPLEYTIRFQNTGNDTAFRVVVVDTLSNQLNYSSFEFLEASHEVVTNLDPSGELSFTFDNILLVDSTTNEPASNGFVSFRIQPDSSLPDSTAILNRAGIYFDFNPPIITNYVINTYALSVTSVSEVENGINASMYPNPSNGQVNIKLEKEVKNALLTVYDVKGSEVFSQDKITTNQIKLDLSSYKDGVYFVRIIEGSNSYSTKLILRRH